jgi:hypothetical protein
VKRIKGDEPNWGVVIIHTCMEISQGNSLYSNLCLKLAKASCFSFYLFSFFFNKIKEWGENMCCKGGGGGVGISGRGEVDEFGVYMNMDEYW